MVNRFSRTQLLLGKGGMERLFHARVAVFGIGGVGGVRGRGAGPQRHRHAGFD